MKKNKFTKSFRRAIYLELAYFYAEASTKETSYEARRYLISNNTNEFICITLEFSCPFITFGEQTFSNLNHFEEFYLFEPTVSEANEEYGCDINDTKSGGWWDNSPSGFAERAEVLFLCAEMCK